MDSLKITNTGIPVLDSLLGGGFLSNSIIVISSQPGAKIRAFALHIVLNSFNEKSHLIDVTFNFPLQERVERVKANMGKTELYEKAMGVLTSDHVSVIDCFKILQEEDSQKGTIHYVSNPFNVENLLSVMAQVRERVPSDRKGYWYFRDLTSMSIGVPEDELLKFCRRAFRYHKQMGDLAVYVMNEKAHTDRFFAKVYQLSDVFIKLIAEEVSGELARNAQVIKSVFPFQSKKVYFDIEQNGDIKFITDKIEERPIISASSLSQAKYLEDKKVKKDSGFFTTGIPQLDFLLGGGIPLNSIMIISQDYGVRITESLANIFRVLGTEEIDKIYINFHYSPKEYVNFVKRYEQTSGTQTAISQGFSKGTLRYIDCFNAPSSEAEKTKGNIRQVSNPYDVDKLLSAMAEIRSGIPEDKLAFWILDDLTSMSIGIPEDELLKFCRRAFRYHKSFGDLALYRMIEQAHSEIFRAKLYELSDVYLRLLGENTSEGIKTSVQILNGVFNFNTKKTKYIIDEKGQMRFED